MTQPTDQPNAEPAGTDPVTGGTTVTEADVASLADTLGVDLADDPTHPAEPTVEEGYTLTRQGGAGGGVVTQVSWSLGHECGAGLGSYITQAQVDRATVVHDNWHAEVERAAAAQAKAEEEAAAAEAERAASVEDEPEVPQTTEG